MDHPHTKRRTDPTRASARPDTGDVPRNSPTVGVRTPNATPNNLAPSGKGFKRTSTTFAPPGIVSGLGILPAARADRRLAFRRPIPPAPIEPYDLVHPAVPPHLDGLTILHLTDLHIRKNRPLMPWVRRALDAVWRTEADLVVHTGDWMNYPGDEASALAALTAFARAVRARAGSYGIFGNHDSWLFRRRARSVPGLGWLTAENPEAFPIPGLRILGFDEPEDPLAVVLKIQRDTVIQTKPDLAQENAPSAPERSLTIALAHYPTEIFPLADLGVPLILAGHTHGGQFRLTARFAPHTSCDLPPNLPGGVLRLRQTLCAVSRGLGNAIVELRLNCPAQIPLYTLRRGPLPPISPRDFSRLTLQRAW